MNRLTCIEVVLLVALAGCATVNGNRDSETRAAGHMHLADSLATAAAYREAALEYAIVAELYPTTSFYPAATRQAAFLHLHPDNEFADDSIALHWFQEYLKATPPSPERRTVEVCVYLLERVQTLHETITRQQVSVDSLAAMTKRQAGELLTLSSRSKQIQSLEAELKKANEELQKLRDVDVRISRGREKK